MKNLKLKIKKLTKFELTKVKGGIKIIREVEERRSQNVSAMTRI